MKNWKSTQDRVQGLTGQDIPIAVLQNFVDDTKVYTDKQLVEHLYSSGLITFSIARDAITLINQANSPASEETASSRKNPLRMVQPFVYGQIKGNERVVLAACAVVAGVGMSWGAVIKVKNMPRKEVIRLMIISGITFIAKEIGSDIVERRDRKRMLFDIQKQEADRLNSQLVEDY